MTSRFLVLTDVTRSKLGDSGLLPRQCPLRPRETCRTEMIPDHQWVLERLIGDCRRSAVARRGKTLTGAEARAAIEERADARSSKVSTSISVRSRRLRRRCNARNEAKEASAASAAGPCGLLVLIAATEVALVACEGRAAGLFAGSYRSNARKNIHRTEANAKHTTLSTSPRCRPFTAPGQSSNVSGFRVRLQCSTMSASFALAMQRRATF